MTKNEKERVLLTGASGSMGFAAFRLLWEKRDRYGIVLLLRPSKKNKRIFREYEREAGIASFPGTGVAEGDRGGTLKIVWGDVLREEDVREACKDIDWCLHTLALISPAADRDPEMAHRVNYLGTKSIVEAIEAQDPERIRMIYIGSVAEYGERLPPVHMLRTGDPIIPSVYDRYGMSKIHAELAVMESKIRHKVSLRQTFIMIPELFSLIDPILFHQPLHTMMETVTVEDAGRLLVNCLDVPADSDFWGGFFNISGGPACRISFLGFLDRIYGMLGLRYEKIMERNWFALKNFHMQFFEDSERLNRYLHHWEGGHTLEDYFRQVWKALPWYLKLVGLGNRRLPPLRWIVERATYAQLKGLSLRQRGTMQWIRDGDTERINVFFGSLEAWKGIGSWDEPLPDLDIGQEYIRLDHGYDEEKVDLSTDDLHQAAAFRGGTLESKQWDGDPGAMLKWRCCRDHPFEMTARTVLLGGHWCPICISPPWEYEKIIKANRFAAQVLSPPAVP
jgi:nucleoside-diphosphate-sugar epimerase